MTIPLFCKDAGRSLLIRRDTDSYGEEGRKLQDNVGNSWRPFGRATGYALGAIAQLIQSEKRSVLGDLVADKITAVFIYLNHISCRGTALLCLTPQVYFQVNSCNNPVGLIAENLQPTLDEVFHVRS